MIDYVSTETYFLNVYNSIRSGCPVLIYTYDMPGQYDAKVSGWVVDRYQEVKIKVTKQKKVLGIVISTNSVLLYRLFPFIIFV